MCKTRRNNKTRVEFNIHIDGDVRSQSKTDTCNKLKRDASLEHFHLRNDKGDLKGFQTKFETLFLQVSVTI